MMVNIENAKKIEGWMKEEELLWLGYQAMRHKRILEVGSWMGRSTRSLCDNCPGGRITAVDSWDGTPGEHEKLLEGKHKDWLYFQFRTNMHDVRNLSVYRGQSKAVLAKLDAIGKKFDFIFIDGDHSYEGCKSDIKGCLKLLDPGGVISGHDFSSSFPGVVRAVKEAFPKARPARAGSIWVME